MYYYYIYIYIIIYILIHPYIIYIPIIHIYIHTVYIIAVHIHYSYMYIISPWNIPMIMMIMIYKCSKKNQPIPESVPTFSSSFSCWNSRSSWRCRTSRSVASNLGPASRPRWEKWWENMGNIWGNIWGKSMKLMVCNLMETWGIVLQLTIW